MTPRLRRSAALLPLLTVAAAPAPVVVVSGGKITGVKAADGKAVLFRGIPFAAAPLGPLRWMPPRPVTPWIGVRDATQRPPACPQNDYGWNAGDHARMSEDCLTLDVRTPSLAGKRPVMVWIHGGSNRAGSAGDTVTSRITDRGVVLVAIHYRLGVLGFLAPREAGTTAGNYGLMDQIAALRWVRDNIGRFGGDPANVTIMGESAGSQDVSLLLAAPAAAGLFARAVMESGTPGFGMPSRSLADARAIGDQAIRLAGPGATLDTLRAAPVDQLLAIDLRLHDASIGTDESMWVKTTIDGSVLPRPIRTLLKQSPKRPVLIGSNRAEFGPAAGSLRFPEGLRPVFGANTARAAALYDFGSKSKPHDPRLGHPELEFWTDWVFRCPAGRVADLLAAKGSPVWRYEFDLPGNRLATHAGEIPYVFDDIRFGHGVSLQPYWVNFARTGDPNGPGLPRWPVYDASVRRHVTFDDRGVTGGHHLRAALCALVDQL